MFTKTSKSSFERFSRRSRREEGAQRLDTSVDGGRLLPLVLDEVFAEGNQVDGPHFREAHGPGSMDPVEPVLENLEVVEISSDGGRGQVLLHERGAELLEELAVGIGGHVLHAEIEER